VQLHDVSHLMCLLVSIARHCDCNPTVYVLSCIHPRTAHETRLMLVFAGVDIYVPICCSQLLLPVWCIHICIYIYTCTCAMYDAILQSHIHMFRHSLFSTSHHITLQGTCRYPMVRCNRYSTVSTCALHVCMHRYSSIGTCICGCFMMCISACKLQQPLHCIICKFARCNHL